MRCGGGGASFYIEISVACTRCALASHRTCNHQDEAGRGECVATSERHGSVVLRHKEGHCCPTPLLRHNNVAAPHRSDSPIIPHGLSVVLTAPGVFRYTGASDPDKHLEAAAILGADVANKKQADAGAVLADTIIKYMDKMQIADGLAGVGYERGDIPALVRGALPQLAAPLLAPITGHTGARLLMQPSLPERSSHRPVDAFRDDASLISSA
ncbi:unnamed protein product [Plutella xylostella]|uniref:(diamondback moth) hypothetical protein n=1 Tax=Plutella xylostella TaxID=51655 RepID=A0A8S4ERV3_PLUXY|nr:unnamed protein product [Plutella xylostella]